MSSADMYSNLTVHSFQAYIYYDKMYFEAEYKLQVKGF